MKKIIFLYFFLMAAPVYAQLSETYIIWLSSITTNQYNILQKFGNLNMPAAHGQPYQLTSIILAPNTRYALVSVVISSSVERNIVNTYQTQGKIQKISDFAVYKDKTPKTTLISSGSVLRNLPTDFYKIW